MSQFFSFSEVGICATDFGHDSWSFQISSLGHQDGINSRGADVVESVEEFPYSLELGDECDKIIHQKENLETMSI